MKNRTAAALAAFLLSLVPALAQQKPDDEQRVMSYPLTMANVRKAVDAVNKAKAAGIADESNAEKGLDAAIRDLESNPKYKPIFAASGISAKDFWMTLNAVLRRAVRLKPHAMARMPLMLSRLAATSSSGS